MTQKFDKDACRKESSRNGTVFVRDEVGSQFQDAEVIDAYGGGGLEKYMLTDDSAEQLAVRTYIIATYDKNPRVQHLLCTKHSWETLKKDQ